MGASWRDIRRWGVAGLAAIAAAALAGGCSKSKNPTVPNTCEATGVELMAFASDRASAGRFDIYLYDLQAGGYHLLQGLNSAAADSNPTVSADSRLVAFTSNRNGSFDLQLYDRASCSYVDLSTINTAGDEVQPAFSYDGRYIVFARDTLGFRHVRILDGSVRPPRYVPMAGVDLPNANDGSPVADQSANVVAFVSDRHGSPDIFLYDHGALREPIGLNTPGAEVDPALSPDGRWLAFASDRDTVGGHASFGIYVYDTQGDTLVPTPGLNTGSNERHPSFSRSNVSTAGAPPSLIGFQSDRNAGNGWDVFVYTLAGHASVSVQPKAGDDVQPWLVWP